VVQRNNIAPLSWHCSKCFSIPQKIPAEVAVAFDSQPASHTPDPFGNCYYKDILDCANIAKPLPNEYAYVRLSERVKKGINNQTTTYCGMEIESQLF